MPLLKTGFSVVLLLPLVPAVCRAQAVPTATAPPTYAGFSLPTVGGSLRYSLSASETIATGGNNLNGTAYYTGFSGNLAYLSASPTHPFSAVYSGGYLIGSSQFGSYPFHSLSLSQVLNRRDWNFVFADTASYVPQSPVAGLSGVPGVGDLNIQPIEIGTNTGLGILTVYAPRVTNDASATATRRITGSTSASVSGDYSIQRYTGKTTSGLDNDGESGTFSVNHRIDVRTNVGGSYNFSNSSLIFRGSNVTTGFRTQSIQGIFNRQITRQLAFQVNAGPQFLMSGNNQLVGKSSVNLTAGAGLNYTGKLYSSGVSYSRGINTGNGVTVGSRYDVVAFNVHRPLARVFQVAGTAGYNHSTSLPGATIGGDYTSNGVAAGGQIGAQVRPSVSVFASYTLQKQSFSGVSLYNNAFNGLTNYLSFGVTYSPQPFFNRK